MEKKLSIAYHEIGHTVALYVQGRAAEYATIEPGPEGRAGHTQPVNNIEEAEIEKDRVGCAKRLLVYTLSAYCAATFAELSPTISPLEREQIIKTQLDVAGLSAAKRGENRGDISQAIKILTILEKELGQNRTECAAEGVQQAMDLVFKYQNPINELALWLLQSGTLTRDRIELVLRRYALIA